MNLSEAYLHVPILAFSGFVMGIIIFSSEQFLLVLWSYASGVHQATDAPGSLPEAKGNFSVLGRYLDQNSLECPGCKGLATHNSKFMPTRCQGGCDINFALHYHTGLGHSPIEGGVDSSAFHHSSRSHHQFPYLW